MKNFVWVVAQKVGAAFVLTTVLQISPNSVAVAAPPESEDCIALDFAKTRTETVTEAGCFWSEVLQSKVEFAVTFPAGFPFVKPAPLSIFLHGRGGNHFSFRDFGGESSLRGHLAAGRPAIVILSPAEPMHRYWKGPSYEMLTEDLIRYVDTIPQLAKGKRKRSIMGISMGGHGAIVVGCRRQDLVSNLFAISPIFRRQNEYLPADLAPLSEPIRRAPTAPAKYYSHEDLDPVLCLRKNSAQRFGPVSTRWRMEIGQQDVLLDEYSQTREVFTEMSQRFGEAVGLAPIGGHDALYWQGAIKRGLDFLTQGFVDKSTTSESRGL